MCFYSVCVSVCVSAGGWTTFLSERSAICRTCLMSRLGSGRIQEVSHADSFIHRESDDIQSLFHHCKRGLRPSPRAGGAKLIMSSDGSQLRQVWTFRMLQRSVCFLFLNYTCEGNASVQTSCICRSNGLQKWTCAMCVVCAGEAKNIPPYPGPNRMRDCYCTVNLDQEEVFRTKIIEKSLWSVYIFPQKVCFTSENKIIFWNHRYIWYFYHYYYYYIYCICIIFLSFRINTISSARFGSPAWSRFALCYFDSCPGLKCSAVQADLSFLLLSPQPVLRRGLLLWDPAQLQTSVLLHLRQGRLQEGLQYRWGCRRVCFKWNFIHNLQPTTRLYCNQRVTMHSQPVSLRIKF